MAAGDSNFYRDLPAAYSLDEALTARHHADLPDDWWVLIAEVAGSTRAIAAGPYKDVNTVGVACIAAVANIDRALELPFLFGGDGATFAIPAMLRERVVPALRAAQKLAREGFGLRLRAGLVQAGELRAQGHALGLGKIRSSAFAFLEERYRAGRLAYGMHKSRAALVTCMVRSYNGDHQHFVDGSDGGYAMAARELKRRMVDSSPSTTTREGAA